MTLIVTDGNSMVADSIFLDGEVRALCDKLIRTADGIIGSAGDAAFTTIFEDWKLGKEDRKPKFKEDDEFTALEIHQGGIFVYDWHLTPMRMRMPFYAIGADKLAALCLLAQGRTLDQVIFDIAEYSNNVRGPVVKMYLDGRTEVLER